MILIEKFVMEISIPRPVCRPLVIITQPLASVVCIPRLLSTCFFLSPLPEVVWIGSNLSSSGLLLLLVLWLFDICCLVLVLMRCALFPFCLSIFFLCVIQRNDYRFGSVRPSAVNLISGIRARVKFYLPLFFKCFRSPRLRRYFTRQWGAYGTICSVVDSELVFSP